MGSGDVPVRLFYRTPTFRVGNWRGVSKGARGAPFGDGCPVHRGPVAWFCAASVGFVRLLD